MGRRGLEPVLTFCAAWQVAKAQETSQRIDEELKDLQATLQNIEQARPFRELTVRVVVSLLDVASAFRLN